MKSMSISRILLAVTATLVVIGSPAPGAAEVARSGAKAHSGDRRCSNRTLSGVYAGHFSGTVLGPDFQITGVAMARYDGNGNFTGVEHVVFNGFAPAVEWTPSTGTYTVNPDCTGRSVTYSANAPPEGLVQFFVVADGGQEKRGVVDGNAFASVDVKVSPAADSGHGRCSNRTLSGRYSAQIVGTILGPNLALRGLASALYDGNGNFTQVDHIVLDGMPPAEEWTPGSGTYTVNPDCTGSAVIHSESSPDPVNLHFVVVDDGTEIHQVVDANAVTAVGTRVK
jgi:hypothetical protein